MNRNPIRHLRLPAGNPLSAILLGVCLLGGWRGEAHDTPASPSAPQGMSQSGQQAMPPGMNMDDMPGMATDPDQPMPGMDQAHGGAGHEHMLMPTPSANLVRILV